MSNVVGFPEKQEPHTTGPAKCLACDYEWTSVAPIGELSLECPSCGCDRGVRASMILYDEVHWTCDCGNRHFLITPNRVYCQNCGANQEPEW